MKKYSHRSEIFYAESIDRVWRALVDPVQLAQWLTKGDFKPVRGHRFKWKEPDSAKNSPLEDALCEIQEVEAPRRLCYRLDHAPDSTSFITWSLETMGEGTRVIVEQELIVASELRPHPKVVSLSLYRLQRTLLWMQTELDLFLAQEAA